MENRKLANPAVIGLAGFGMTTLILQFHNLGLAGLGPVLAMAFVFGGLAQFIAGFMEQKTGNNFGFSAFVAYGSFWMGLGVIWLCNHFGVYKLSTTDVGFYLLGWTLLTAIYFIGSLYIHKAMTYTFATLLLGFILLDFGHFGMPIMNKVAGVELIVCSGCAWYMMTAIIINDLAGKTVLPFGTAFIKK